jgi:hypothetical protein
MTRWLFLWKASRKERNRGRNKQRKSNGRKEERKRAGINKQMNK